MERRIRSLIRWNALAMVVRANRRAGDLGVTYPVLPRRQHFTTLGLTTFFVRPCWLPPMTITLARVT